MEEKKIKQVLINLIMNARYAVGEQGVITVRTTCDEASAQAVIRIEDTGGGIAPEHLARIFDPFFTTKPTGEGTGLGLSVSYGIVKKHGGEITVQSRPGEGAAFTVTLPLPSAAGR
jgi:signal transduction histidine kinase